MARTGSTTSTSRSRRKPVEETPEVIAEQITDQSAEATEAEVSPTTDEAQEANDMSTQTVEDAAQADAVADEAAVASAEASDTTEVDEAAKAADEKFTEFEAAVETALANRDETTGTVPEVNLEAVKTAYRELPGAKYKGKAKSALNAKLKETVNSGNIVLAQATMACSEAIEHVGPSPRKETERKPADPAEDFRNRVSVLHLAYALAKSNVPEGVDADEQSDLIEAKVGEEMASAEAYFAWATSTAEDKGDEPEASALVKLAVKAAQGKAATVTRSRSTSSTPRAPHSGGNRNVRTHIAQAFEGQPSGTDLRINAVAKTKTAEYPEGDCSPGAISAAFDSQRGVEGFQMVKDDKGVKTVRKL